MSVRLRFQRVGMPKQPYYRLVAIDRRSARDAAEIEVLGHYNPKNKDNALTVKADRIQHWISRGAQPSDTVKSLLLKNRLFPSPEKTQGPA